MKKIFVWFPILACMLLTPLAAEAYYKDGGYWMLLSPDEKDVFVLGYLNGYERAAEVGVSMGLSADVIYEPFMDAYHWPALERFVDGVYRLYERDERYLKIPVYAIVEIVLEMYRQDFYEKTLIADERIDEMLEQALESAGEKSNVFTQWNQSFWEKIDK